MGSGNYTNDRHKFLKNLTVKEALDEIERKEAEDKLPWLLKKSRSWSEEAFMKSLRGEE